MVILTGIDDVLEEFVRKSDMMVGAIQANDLHSMQMAWSNMAQLVRIATKHVKTKRKMVIQ
jgi:hypothetical protein